LRLAAKLTLGLGRRVLGRQLVQDLLQVIILEEVAFRARDVPGPHDDGEDAGLFVGSIDGSQKLVATIPRLSTQVSQKLASGYCFDACNERRCGHVAQRRAASVSLPFFATWRQATFASLRDRLLVLHTLL
jgi:hypothetical protein